MASHIPPQPPPPMPPEPIGPQPPPPPVQEPNGPRYPVQIDIDGAHACRVPGRAGVHG